MICKPLGRRSAPIMAGTYVGAISRGAGQAQEALSRTYNPCRSPNCRHRWPLRWPGGGRTPLDEAIRGSTDQPAARALISRYVTRRHDQAPHSMNAHGLVMRRPGGRVARDFSGTFSSVGGTSEGDYAVQARKTATALKGSGLRARASAQSLRSAPAGRWVGSKRRGSSGPHTVLTSGDVPRRARQRARRARGRAVSRTGRSPSPSCGRAGPRRPSAGAAGERRTAAPCTRRTSSRRPRPRCPGRSGRRA